ncbi:unnamed protein product [Ambrosiozyma monospora]|uniref:Unnamed protein product n=1 Tax=Ambrosiozyma monospora TaxID=43982 RepID=A0A9W7DIS0_AMBMO|nr:unnamed protein product [Ambrosiozyma monospora]
MNLSGRLELGSTDDGKWSTILTSNGWSKLTFDFQLVIVKVVFQFDNTGTNRCGLKGGNNDGDTDDDGGGGDCDRVFKDGVDVESWWVVIGSCCWQLLLLLMLLMCYGIRSQLLLSLSSADVDVRPIDNHFIVQISAECLLKSVLKF